MNEKKALEVLVKNARPPISLSYVLDDKGDLLAHFDFHTQQEDEITITLDKVSTRREVFLTPTNVREFAKQLLEYADLVDAVLNKYYE